MAPPGLARLFASARALHGATSAPAPRFTLDLGRMARAVGEGTTTYTPPVTTLYGLDAALGRIEVEGLPTVFRRHEELAAECRAGLELLGLTVAAAEGLRSATVTAVRLPDGIQADRVRARLEQEHSALVSGARAHWVDTHPRIGHMGWVSDLEVQTVTAALARVLEDEVALR